MSEFSKLYLTKKGQALMAKVIAGQVTNLTFTKVSTSSKVYAESALENLTALEQVQQTNDVTKVTITNSTSVKVETAFTNEHLTAGYYLRSLGLYARDPDVGEILYAVCVETSGLCYMPAYNGVTVSSAYIQLYTTVGNSDDVNLSVYSGAYATVEYIETLENNIADLQAFVGYVDNHIFGVEVDFVNKRFTRLAGASGKAGGSPFDAVRCFGGRRRCNVTDNGKVVAYYGEAGFSTSGELMQAVQIGSGRNAGTYPIGTKVQVMVEQPKFYYKVVPLETEIVTEGEHYGSHIRKARYYVCDEPQTGFKVHPAFMRNGEEADYIYLSAFEGSIYNVDSDFTISYDNTTVYTETIPDITMGVTIVYNTINANITPAKFREAITNNGDELTMPSNEVYGIDDVIDRPDNITADHANKVALETSSTTGYITRILEIFRTANNDVPTTFNATATYTTSKYLLNDEQVADFTTDKFSSIGNVKPASGLTQNLTRANVRKLAQNRGAGWEQAYAATISASQLLMLIEYGSFNMQSAIGNGVVSKTDDNSTNMSELTGATISLGNASGQATNTSGQNLVSYRGEENFWGNIWGWVDGLNCENPNPFNNSEYGTIYVADHDFADNTGALPYEDTDIHPCKTTGAYISAFGYNEKFDWLFIPTEVKGNSALPVGDNFWNGNTGWRVARLGGAWNDGSRAGAFALALSDASSSRRRSLGGRLVYFPTEASA